MALKLINGTKEQPQGLTPEQVEQAFSDYYKPIFNYLYYRTLNRAVAEDLTSDVFMKVVRSRESYNPQLANVETWIFRIARNRLFDYFRSNKPTEDLENVAEGAYAEQDRYDGLSDNAVVTRKLLAVLTDEQRELVFLKFWREMSNVQIAELLQMNPSTVSTRLSRAVAKMRKAAESA